MPFRIEWKKFTLKELRKLPASVGERTIEAVGVEKLAGSRHAYRIRLGDYRVVYEVVTELKLIEIQRVRHRKDVYR